MLTIFVDNAVVVVVVVHDVLLFVITAKYVYLAIYINLPRKAKVFLLRNIFVVVNIVVVLVNAVFFVVFYVIICYNILNSFEVTLLSMLLLLMILIF